MDFYRLVCVCMCYITISKFIPDIFTETTTYFACNATFVRMYIYAILKLIVAMNIRFFMCYLEIKREILHTMLKYITKRVDKCNEYGFTETITNAGLKYCIIRMHTSYAI